jgi:hypothetical protein
MKDFRSYVRVLYYRAYLLVAKGNNDEAVRSALMIFRLARRYDRNPTLVGHLGTITAQGYAIKSASLALETGVVSEKVHEALEAECALCESMDGYVWALKSERALVLDLLRTSRARNVSEFLDETQTFLSLARNPVPYREAVQIIGKMPKRAWYDTSAFAGTDVDYPKATYQAVIRVRATIRSLRVLSALQRHVPPGSDKTPKLTELGLPAEAITDPYTGEPLHVKKTPQGWLVYSVGPNGEDDGGKLDNPNTGDVGVGPPQATAKPDEPAKK